MTEDFDLKFRAAWEVFASTCALSVAPEATYQVWLAHYLISQFGIDRVAREPNFKHKHFRSHYRESLRGNEVKLDVVIARSPGIDLPHYVHRESAGEGGIGALSQLAVIAELKVSATQGEGLEHTEVCMDFWKLSMLLEEADSNDIEAPLAYVCILDNHRSKTYNFDWLGQRLDEEGFDARVKMLRFAIPR